jgi:hypothetical protein
MARSLRELGFVTFGQGLEGETEDLWQAAYVLQCELGDQQGIIDSRFFPSIIALSRGDWQRARTIAEHVTQLANEMNNTIYLRWASRTLEIAASIEESSYRGNSMVNAWLHVLTPFTALIQHVVFSYTWRARRNQVLGILALAATDLEIAICLPFAAELLGQADVLHRATMLLALAFRDVAVAESWIVHLPEITALQQKLRNHMPPAELARAWEQGQTLDLRVVAAEVQGDLAKMQGDLQFEGWE